MSILNDYDTIEYNLRWSSEDVQKFVLDVIPSMLVVEEQVNLPLGSQLSTQQAPVYQVLLGFMSCKRANQMFQGAVKYYFKRISHIWLVTSRRGIPGTTRK